MKKIILYAPVDCEVKSITKCSDQTFSQKILGDGVVIIPQNNIFKCPFKKAKVLMIFETKHAYGLKVDDFEVMIHCGIDTVSLKGDAFETKLKENDELKIGENLFIVNLDLIKSKNLSIETPIVFSLENIETFKFTQFKEGFFKSGEKIAEIEITKKQAETTIELKSFKSKYKSAAEEFVQAIGGKTNFSEVWNCMTRLRFKINDKSIVNEEKIKKNFLVKGIIWNGPELQIIIGGENHKVKDEILKLDQEVFITKKSTSKQPFSKRVTAAMTGIMTPMLPILMGVAIISAFYAIMMLTGAAKFLGAGSPEEITNANLLSIILYITCRTGLVLVGVFFCINTVKYFGGNYLVGAFVGVVLVSRFFYSTGITDPDLYSFGHYVVSEKYLVRGLYLFSVFDYPIVIRSYEGTVLPFIFAGIIASYSDKWIKTWMPANLDMIFRYAIVFAITLLPTMFVLGPILGILEFGIAQFTFLIEEIPFGLGVGILAFIWQPFVITGLHGLLTMIMFIPLVAGLPSALIPATAIGVWAQIGITIGVYFRTKNKNFKTTILKALPGAAAFGLTEPIIFGVTLPKWKLFLLACIASLFGGILSGWMGVKIDVPTAPGIFHFLSFSKTKILLFALLANGSTIALSFLFGFLFYSERKNEYLYSRRISNKLLKIMKKLNYKNKELSKVRMTELLKKVKAEKNTFSNYEKFLVKLTKIEDKIMCLELKDEKIKNKLYLKATTLSGKPKIDEKLKQNAILKYNNFSLDKEIKGYLNQKENINKEYKSIKEKYYSLIKELEILVKPIVENFASNLKIEEINKYYNGYWNAIHCVDIGYGYEEKKDYNLSKKSKQYLKTLMCDDKIQSI